MHKIGRNTLVAVGTCAVLVSLGVLGAHPVGSDTVSDRLLPPVTTTTVPVPTRATTEPDCTESDACWNSCTMGDLNPCDLYATLPYGARFRVELNPMPLATHGDMCDAGQLVHVTVSAVTTDETVAALADESVCVGSIADFGMSIATVLPSLYREAAAQLDAQ